MRSDARTDDRSSDRREALERIAELARAHGITANEIAARLGASPGGAERLVRRIFAYLGAIFVLAGAVAAVNLFWDDLGSAARVAWTLGPGLAATLLALAATRQPRFEAAATPLFLVAALLQTSGLFVFLDEYAAGGDAALGATAVFGVMALQSLLLFVAARRTGLAFLSVLFGFACAGAAMAWLDVDGGLSALVLGVAGLLVTWRIDATPYRAFTPLAFFAFGTCVAAGAFELLEGAFPVDFVLVGVAGALVHGGVLARSRSLLATGVLAMLAYLGYFTGEYFADMLSWPIALVAMGLLMLVLSSYAVRLGRGLRRRD
jgi:hypothetical protein